MEDISVKGKHAWASTKTDPNGTSNKLDCIVVSSNVVRDTKAKVTLIKDPAAVCIKSLVFDTY